MVGLALSCTRWGDLLIGVGRLGYMDGLACLCACNCLVIRPRSGQLVHRRGVLHSLTSHAVRIVLGVYTCIMCYCLVIVRTICTQYSYSFSSPNYIQQKGMTKTPVKQQRSKRNVQLRSLTLMR